MNRLAGIGILILVAAIRADERTYSLSIDGKHAGDFSLISHSALGGETEVRSKLDIADKQHSFSYRGTERWKDGHLVRLEGSGKENGKSGTVSLVSGKSGYTLKAGIKEVAVRGDVWPTTFWMRPDTEKPLVVDAVTGDVARGKVEKIGPDRLMVDGKLLPVTKYRLTFGGAATELWYDSAGRLARRKWQHNGRSIVIELTHIKTD